MGVERLLILLAVGFVAGWIAAKLMRGGGLGILGNIVVGVIGAVIGNHVLRLVNLSPAGWLAGLPFAPVLSDLITATLGAVLLLLVVGVLKRA